MTACALNYLLAWFRYDWHKYFGLTTDNYNNTNAQENETLFQGKSQILDKECKTSSSNLLILCCCSFFERLWHSNRPLGLKLFFRFWLKVLKLLALRFWVIWLHLCIALQYISEFILVKFESTSGSVFSRYKFYEGPQRPNEVIVLC